MPDFTVDKEGLKMIGQALIQARSNLRSAENLIDTISPFANQRTAQELEKIVVNGQDAARVINAIYKRNAVAIFGEDASIDKSPV